MAALNDEIFRVLRQSFTGARNEMMVEFLQGKIVSVITPQSTINDAWLSLGLEQVPIGRTVNESQKSFYLGAAATGDQLNDLAFDYWSGIN